MNPSTFPKISCLMITRDRMILLKEAIRCYCDQTYPHRELVIVSAGTKRYQQAVADHVGRLGRDDVRLVFLDGDDYTLGRQRNISLESARGEIICQWDDDDLYHPERLRTQWETMIREQAQACFMTDHLQFLVQERMLFWIDWAYGGVLGERGQLVPGTVMMYKDDRFRYPEAGPDAHTGEDNAFRNAFFDKLDVAKLQGAAFLYIYRYHGKNTLAQEHHNRVTVFGSREGAFMHAMEPALRHALQYYTLPMPYKVMTREGHVHFVVNG